jgi:pimeloyl-ACP methyl ester carboxylesterase
MEYKEYGSDNSEMLVFLHGGGVGGWMWNNQVRFFSSKYHCLVPEIVAMNKSYSDHFTIEEAADEVIQLIKSIGKQKQVYIIGFSLGAQIAVSAISKEPTMFKAAMINSALVKPVPFAKLLIKAMLPTLPLTRNRTFSDIQAKSMYIEKEYLETYYLSNKGINSRLFADIMTENMIYTIPTAFSESSSKILLTIGEEEIRSMKASLKDLSQANHTARTFIVPNIGHGFPLAAPELFNETLEQFLLNTEKIDS